MDYDVLYGYDSNGARSSQDHYSCLGPRCEYCLSASSAEDRSKPWFIPNIFDLGLSNMRCNRKIQNAFPQEIFSQLDSAVLIYRSVDNWSDPMWNFT